jgi:hypothetical protein
MRWESGKCVVTPCPSHRERWVVSFMLQPGTVPDTHWTTGWVLSERTVHVILSKYHILISDQEITEENSPSGTLPRSTTWEIPSLVTFTRLSGTITFPNFMNSSVASKWAQRYRSRNMYSFFKKCIVRWQLRFFLQEINQLQIFFHNGFSEQSYICVVN